MIFFISGETLIFSLVGENAKTTRKIDRFFGANLGENSGILRQNTVETRLKSRKSSTEFFWINYIICIIIKKRLE